MRPPAADAPTAAALRADLEAWTVDAVSALVGDRAFRALGREQVVPARIEARAAGDSPAAVLTRLFMLGDEVSRAHAETALTHVGVRGAERIGLLEAAGAQPGDAVRAVVDLRPYAAMAEGGQVDWWICSDQGEAVTARAVGQDHVLGLGGASTTLASVTMRTPRRRVLDIGTGCGIQAMHASLHADAVVATDISTRALAYARFNETVNAQALGGQGGSHRATSHRAWDLREGSMLEPVAGEAFDLVVSNPPFVITPPGAPTYEYRHGGAAGDGVTAGLIRDVGTVLEPGGVAQLLGNWEIRGDGGAGDWRDRIGQWLDAAPVPLDAWIVQRDALDAAEYAETWLRDGGVTVDRDAALWSSAYEAYLRAFDEGGVEAIGFGLVVLRRPQTGSPSLRRFEEHEGALAMPLGPTLAGALEAHDWLASASDAAVLDTAFTVAPDVTKETHGRPLEAHPEHILLRQGGGFGRVIK
ncbi:MAG: methyltransferase, partial [Demequina sp.]